jgi:plastocyanin
VRGRWTSAGLALILASLPWLATACSLTGGSTTNEHERTVLVDYHFDQFAAVFPAYFPKQVTIRQGDTIVFKQAWNGEPHSITAGTLVDEPFQAFWPVLKNDPPFPSAPPNAPAIQAAEQKYGQLPNMYAQTANLEFAQNGAQPCFLDSGTPPTDAKTACPKRAKPAFTGSQAYYSSGLLPYQGEQGNIFRIAIDTDAPPGTHYYYCALHGLLMSGAFTIVAKTATIPSQAEVNAAAQKEIAKYTDPASKVYGDAKAGKAPTKGNLAGVDVDPTVTTELTEFVPRSVKTRVGQKVTWHVVGDFHTISFDVPKYLPEVVIDKGGLVRYSDDVVKPVAGPGFPDCPNSGGSGPSSGPPPPLPPFNVDAGNYDGAHFLSSGTGGPCGGPGVPQDVTYGVTFTKAGTFKFACLVHPLMVGEVVVQ